MPTVRVLIHAAPLWLLPEHIAAFRKSGVQRIVAFSSTSVLAKVHSHSDYERNLVQRLTAAESACLQRSHSPDIPITIFRPTMIYGYGRDHNVSAISHFIRKYGFFPVSNRALGLRQPVHADDLVNATLAVIENTRTFHKCYQMSGGEVLTYRDMVRRIFDGLGKAARFLAVPKQLYRGVIWVYAGFSKKSGLAPDMVSRMSQNLNFSHMPATQDFHYRPGAFLTNPDRDLL